MKNRFIILFLTLFLVLILTGSVSATNKTVTPGKNSIQNAIISSSNGDTLNLAPGTYYEHDILVNKNLTINGPKPNGHGVEATINSQNIGRVFKTCAGVKLTLNYLKLQNGDAYKDKDCDYGGGIYSKGKLTLNNCNIMGNKAEYGGGIYCEYGLLVVSSNINHNLAVYGGGVNALNPLVLINSNINNNIARIYGGGINVESSATIKGSNINNNTALYQGGGVYTNSNLNIADTNLYFNTAKYSGGAIYSTDSPKLSIISCNLVRNSATNNFGGAVYAGCMYKSQIDYALMRFSRIFGNSANLGKNICCMNGYFNATLNWWGSNNNPSRTVAGNVSTNPRLMFTINMNSSTIVVGDNAKVTTDLRHDSNGCYHNPSNGHVPNMILNLFTTLGSINNSIPMYRGSATAKLMASNKCGSGYVFAVLDSETVRTTFKINPLHKIIGF